MTGRDRSRGPAKGLRFGPVLWGIGSFGKSMNCGKGSRLTVCGQDLVSGVASASVTVTVTVSPLR